MGFPGFFCFLGTWRNRPPSAASHGDDHIAPWQLLFAHPCPAHICQKRGNAKKYPSPNRAASFKENNLAGTFAAPAFFFIPARKPLCSPRRLHWLPRCPDNGAAAGADIFDAAVNGFLTPAFGGAFYRQAAGVDFILSQNFSDPCLRGQRRYRPAILGVLLDMQAVSLGSGLKFLVVIVYG